MLGFFPDPYPDELLYSACARYMDRLKYPNQRTGIQELFGAAQTPAIVDFPNRLDNLIKSLPPFHQYTSLTEEDYTRKPPMPLSTSTLIFCYER